MLTTIKGYFSPGVHRKMLRRRLLVLSIPPALLVIAVGVKLVMMVIYGNAAHSDYLKYDSDALAGDVRVLKSFNVIDSYKAYFAEGDRYVLEGKLADAKAQYRQSLSLVDQNESCPVRINLEVVLEALGDLKNADKHPDEAAALWQEALTVVREAPAGCFDAKDEPDQDRREHVNSTSNRLENKMKPQPSGGGGGGDGGEDGPSEQSPSPGVPQSPPQQSGDQGGQGSGPAPSAPAAVGGPTDKAPDNVGADRITTDAGGAAIHQLNPADGDPNDVLKRLLENSDATGIDRDWAPSP